MAETYLTTIATQIGIPLWLLLVVFLWEAIWKIAALWKSARKGHIVWFIVIALVNTIGILPILYIYVFSKMKIKEKKINEKKEKIIFIFLNYPTFFGHRFYFLVDFYSK